MVTLCEPFPGDKNFRNKRAITFNSQGGGSVFKEWGNRVSRELGHWNLAKIHLDSNALYMNSGKINRTSVHITQSIHG